MITEEITNPNLKKKVTSEIIAVGALVVLTVLLAATAYFVLLLYQAQPDAYPPEDYRTLQDERNSHILERLNNQRNEIESLKRKQQRLMERLDRLEESQ